MESHQVRPQVSVEISGIVTLLRPQTPEGRSWLRNYLNLENWPVGAYPVQSQGVPAMLAAMSKAGLIFEVGDAPSEDDILCDAIIRLHDEASGDWNKFDYSAAELLDRARNYLQQQDPSHN